MEIYYTTKITGRAGVIAGWSKAPGYPSYLAVALSPNAVGIYNEEGRPLDPNNEANIKNVRGTECAKLAWHPLLPLLAIGWKDGAISFWNAEERKLEEDSKIHRNTISSMTWTSSGDRLITGDENGRISMWKTDRLLRPIHVVAYDEPGAVIRHIVVGLPEEVPETNSQVVVAFYVADGTERATVKWCNDQGYSGVVQEMGESIHSLVHYPERDQLLVIGASCTLNVLARDEQLGAWATTSKMKFATGTGEAASGTGLQVAWAGNHTLASASEKDNVVRMYNFDTEDNYVLNLEQDSGLVSRVVCLAFDQRYHLLAVGTTDGRVMMYKYNEPSERSEPVLELAKCWEMQPAFFVGNRALSMEWGPFPRLMVVACSDAINVCRKTMLSYKYRDGVAIMQVAVDRVVLENMELEPQRPPGRLQLQDMQLLGLDLSKGLLLVWDGERAEVYKVTEANDIMAASQFETSSRCMAINNDSIYRAAENKLEVVNMAGTVKQTIMFDDNHGSPAFMDVARDFLVTITNLNFVRIFKVAGREAKPHAGPAPLCPAELKGWKVISAKVNGTGSMVAALLVGPEPSRAVRLVVWCGESNTHHVHDFTPDNRVPVGIMWDTVEPKLLVVQTAPTFNESNLDEKPAGGDGSQGPDVAIIFVDTDKGILLQEYQSIHQGGATACIGSAAPFLLTNRKCMVQPAPGSGGYQPFTSNVSRVLMTSFVGMQDSDEKTRRALLDFSFSLATGNMDEAFRSVKAIKNPAVWENMAHMCIRNKRLDVAEHCLSNMEHARGARALREAKTIEEADARVATVAVHLGMIEDAKKLYIACERYDLLNQLYRACGQWDKALEVAEKNDRIHLKSTHYAYAQYLERAGDLTNAQKHYESSGCGLVEVPRMLFEAEKFNELQAYIQANDSRELILWWGKYLESLGEYGKALDCYRKAGDSLSMVRIYCFQKEWKQAEEEVTNSNDQAGAFHLARQYEAAGRIPEAVRYYTLAKRYSHGVRLAKVNELDSDLMNLALKSTPVVMIDTADYLFQKGQHEKAATLYMKGGKLSKAVEMCFQAQLFDVLQHIADDMSPDKSDPTLYNRCAEFFMQFGHNDKAVKMLIAAQQYSRALELCVEHDVPISEEMADSMTPDKSIMKPDERNGVICRIAKVAKRQGNYQLAAKKYTQAGDKVKAMKALLRGGDAEKIIFFAGVSRQKDLYLMAANYLQTLNWHSDPELMKHIISFYTKATAWDSLANFYEACAQIEVDEYRDYEKALQAMREAAKYIAKSKSDDRDQRLAAISDRITVSERFVEARQLIATNPTEALRVCEELLQTIPQDSQDLEAGIRIGDVYALMVEYWYEARQPMEAYKAIEAMRRRGIILSPYLDTRMVEDIYKALGVAPDMAEDRRGPADLGLHGERDTDNGGFIEEEVADDDD
ncbi:hypothetical protein Vafri_2223 [Volvox africanus]|nr:hypothetical protein Vafri_2223 [Volvox africanus]